MFVLVLVRIIDNLNSTSDRAAKVVKLTCSQTCFKTRQLPAINNCMRQVPIYLPYPCWPRISHMDQSRQISHDDFCGWFGCGPSGAFHAWGYRFWIEDTISNKYIYIYISTHHFTIDEAGSCWLGFGSVVFLSRFSEFHTQVKSSHSIWGNRLWGKGNPPAQELVALLGLRLCLETWRHSKRLKFVDALLGGSARAYLLMYM